MTKLYFLAAAATGLAGLLLTAPAKAQAPSTAPAPEAAASAAAQPAKPAAPRPPKNLIKIAPLAWVHGQLPFSTESRIGYERVVSRRGSVGGSYSYLGTNYPFSFIGSVAMSAAISTAFVASGHAAVVWTATRFNTSGHRYQLQYRHYLGRRGAPEGFYLAPHFSHATASYDIHLKKAPDVGVGIKLRRQNYNLLLGYQEVAGKHFVIDVFTGLGYRRNRTELYTREGTYLQTMPTGTKFKLSGGLNLGWAF